MGCLGARRHDVRWGHIFSATIGLALWPLTAQAACLPINSVELSGVTLFSPAESRGWVTPYEGRCLGLEDFDAILEQITLAYVDAGYVLSRAYLPEQNLADGSLDIDVVEGHLAAVTVNGRDDEASRRWMRQIFPGQIGQPVHIRRIEQGLDQIRTMPRWQASFEFDPGATPGDSVMKVSAETAKPIEFRFSANNNGSADSGDWILGMSGDVTNQLGLNETLSFGVTHSATLRPPQLGNGNGDYSRSANVDISIPYGRFTFDAGWSGSAYHLTIPGAQSDIPTDGDTSSFSFGTKYLLSRDQGSKTYLSMDLDRAANRNRVMGVQVDSSSRVLTSLRATLSHERTIWDGPFSGSLFVEHGLKLLGAEDAAAQAAGQPDAQYLLAGFSASYSHGIDVPTGQLTWTSTMNGQVSTDRLYGSQQFSIGGASTVRGTRIALASGSSGVFWRNGLEYRFDAALPEFLGTPSVYAGLDLGKVFAQSAVGATGGSAVGSVFGVKLNSGALSFDASWQQVLAVSSGLQKPGGLAALSLEVTF